MLTVPHLRLPPRGHRPRLIHLRVLPQQHSLQILQLHEDDHGHVRAHGYGYGGDVHGRGGDVHDRDGDARGQPLRAFSPHLLLRC